VLQLTDVVRRRIMWQSETNMIAITVEVDIEHGKLTARQPHLLPENGVGLMAIVSSSGGVYAPRRRVSLPLVACVPGSVVNPTAKELDDSLWD
jgi:hypothetical protein